MSTLVIVLYVIGVIVAASITARKHTFEPDIEDAFLIGVAGLLWPVLAVGGLVAGVGYVATWIVKLTKKRMH